MEKPHDDLMRDAQYRKSRSIAFFSSQNAAIELLKSMKGFEILTDEQTYEQIIKWRDWFLAEYDRDYKENVMTIGLPPTIIPALDNAKKAYESSN